MMWELLGEYWRLVVVGATGLLVLAFRGRLPRWVIAAWGLLVAAVALAWVVGMSWPGTLVLFVGFAVIASALWLRAEERKVEPTPPGSAPS